MPTMYEIYDKYADEYDELIIHEDYQENLQKTLQERFDFLQKDIIEFGCGTGRVTELYIDKVKSALCFDRSHHMLKKAKKKLTPYSEKLQFEQRSNTDFTGLDKSVDFIIEGWSIFHTIKDSPSKIKENTAFLIHHWKTQLKEKGTIILIESKGTNTERPKIKSDELRIFTDLLENEYGFKCLDLRTDYKFDSIGDAKRIMGFFFGDQMSDSIKEKIVPEFTGIWYWEKRKKIH